MPLFDSKTSFFLIGSLWVRPAPAKIDVTSFILSRILKLAAKASPASLETRQSTPALPTGWESIGCFTFVYVLSFTGMMKAHVI